MKTRIVALLIFFTLGGFKYASAQQKSTDIFHDENGNTYHQVFLDFHITEIIEIKYTIDESPVEGELSTDGYSVIIKNYPGDKSVKLIVKDDTGAQKEVVKSRCFIDPVILEL